MNLIAFTVQVKHKQYINSWLHFDIFVFYDWLFRHTHFAILGLFPLYFLAQFSATVSSFVGTCILCEPPRRRLMGSHIIKWGYNPKNRQKTGPFTFKLLLTPLVIISEWQDPVAKPVTDWLTENSLQTVKPVIQAYGKASFVSESFTEISFFSVRYCANYTWYAQTPSWNVQLCIRDCIQYGRDGRELGL